MDSKNYHENIMDFIKRRLSHIDIDPNYYNESQYWLCNIIHSNFFNTDLYYVPEYDTIVVGSDYNRYYNYMGEVKFNDDCKIIKLSTYIKTLSAKEYEKFTDKYIN